MTEGSTKYLDKAVLDSAGVITKEVIEAFKSYCGLFALIFSIYNTNLPDYKKDKLLKALLNSTLEFMEKRYQVNINFYLAQATDAVEQGKLFETFSEIPAKMQEDYEKGIADAKELIAMEIEGMVKVIHDFLNT